MLLRGDINALTSSFSKRYTRNKKIQQSKNENENEKKKLHLIQWLRWVEWHNWIWLLCSITSLHLATFEQAGFIVCSKTEKKVWM